MTASDTGDEERLPIACYGKLPLHPEYLRRGLESEAAQRVVAWVDGAHAALTAARKRSGRSSPPSRDESLQTLERFALLRSKRPGIVAGVAARSSDGLREHPIALFVEVVHLSEPSAAGAGSATGGDPSVPHLASLPATLEPIWAHLSSIVRSPGETRDDLLVTLARGCPPPAKTTSSIDLARGIAATPPAIAGWQGLTASTGDEALHRAANLLAVVAAQREARTPDEGVALTVPLVPGDEETTAQRGGAWLRLLAALVEDVPGCQHPTMVLGISPARLFVFFRPVEGDDLAAVLDDINLAPIDDLNEPWQRLPAAGSKRRVALERFVGSEAADMETLVTLAREASSVWAAPEA